MAAGLRFTFQKRPGNMEGRPPRVGISASQGGKQSPGRLSFVRARDRFHWANPMSLQPAALISRALAADARAARELVSLLEPVIRARVARVLRRSSPGGAWHSQVADRVQDIFSALFEDRGRVLRSWEPDRGLSLENFVGLFAERRTISALRGQTVPLQESETDLEEVSDEGEGSSFFIESSLVTKELLVELLERLRLELSALGMQIFHLIYVEEKSVEEVMACTGMSVDAIYAWRSRLKRLVSKLTLDWQTTEGRANPIRSRGVGNAS